MYIRGEVASIEWTEYLRLCAFLDAVLEEHVEEHRPFDGHHR